MAPIAVKKLSKDDEVGQIIQKHFVSPICVDYYLFGEEETCLPKYYEKYAEVISNFEVRDDDVWICTYPKVGTTWTQEMVWLIANNCDFETAHKEQLLKRSPFIELCGIFDTEAMKEIDENTPSFVTESLEFTKNLPSPRHIKTHLPFSLLPEQLQNGSKKAKIIYVLRDPKDVAVSYYHHGQLFQEWNPSMDDFIKVFTADKAMWGSFWKHVFGYWQRRNCPDMLIISYEDMKKDLGSIVKRTAKFLNKEVPNGQIDKLLQHLSFESMRNNNSVNYEELIMSQRAKKLISEEQRFIRSGTVGKYKEELSKENIEKLKMWIEANASGTDFAQEFQHYF